MEKIFECETAELFEALSKISRGVPNRNALPILDCVYFCYKDITLNVCAGGSHQRMSFHAGINSWAEGKFCLNLKRLLSALKHITEDVLTFELTGKNTIKISFTGGSFILPMENADDYPVWDELENYSTITVPSEEFISAMRGASKCAANDVIHPVLNSVYICMLEFGDSADIVGTDGSILMKNTVKVNSFTSAGYDSLIMPTDAAVLLTQFSDFENDEYFKRDEVVIEFTDKLVRVKFGGYTLSSVLIGGKYPRYNSVIPTEHTVIAKVNRKSLIGNLGFVSSFAPVSKRPVRMSVVQESRSLVLKTEDMENGVSSDCSMELAACDNSITIGLNIDNFTKALSLLVGENVAMEMTDSTRAVILHPCIDEQKNNIILLMPLCLDRN